MARPALHIRASGCTPHFVEYTRNARAFAEHPNRRPHAGREPPPLPQARPAAIVRWPLSAATTARQHLASQAQLGIPVIDKFVCHKCTCVHIKTDRQPRAAKARNGVSVQITDLTQAWCNQCDTPVARVPITGFMTRAIIGKPWRIITVCCGCGLCCTDPKLLGELYFCSPCHAAATVQMIEQALPCPCGAHAHATDTLTLMLHKNKTIICKVCSNHVYLTKGHDIGKWSDWQHLFRSLSDT
jgi:hypothetical protein